MIIFELEYPFCIAVCIEDIYQISNSLFIWMAELEVSSLCMYLYFISCLPCTHTHTHIDLYTYVCIYIHILSHVFIYICMYMYTHTLRRIMFMITKQCGWGCLSALDGVI